MLLLALSDAHIPERAIDIPLKFRKLLSVPNKIQQVALLGNCSKSISFLNFVNSISNNIVLVRGEFDSQSIPTKKDSKEEIPLNTVITQGEFRIGCCNGYTLVPKNDPLSLLTLARQLDVDILLWGGTHNVEAYTLEGKFFINPGSCTGAFSTDWVLKDVEDNIKATNDAIVSDTSKKASVSETEQNNDKESNPSSMSEDKTQNKNADTTADEVSKRHLSSGSADDGKEHGESSDDEEFDESDINGGGIPSFCLLDIQESTCTLYIYTFVENEVKVDKVVYKKE